VNINQDIVLNHYHTHTKRGDIVNERMARKIYNKLIMRYKELDEDSKEAIFIDIELEYYYHKMRGRIICSYHPSEGCSQCKFIEECELRG
jgi:hypothetical protein